MIFSGFSNNLCKNTLCFNLCMPHDFEGSWNNLVGETYQLNSKLVFRCCLVVKSCLTLCDSVDRSLPGSSVRGIFWARIVECIAISISRRSCQPGEPWQADSLPLSHLGSILYQIRENDQYILLIIHSNHPPNKEFLSFFLFF